MSPEYTLDKAYVLNQQAGESQKEGNSRHLPEELRPVRYSGFRKSVTKNLKATLLSPVSIPVVFILFPS